MVVGEVQHGPKEEEKLIAIDRDFHAVEDQDVHYYSASYWEDKKDMFHYLERIDFKGGESYDARWYV